GDTGCVEGGKAHLSPVEGHTVGTVRGTFGQVGAGDRVAEGDHSTDGLVTVFTDPVRTGAVGVLGVPSGGVAFDLTDAGRAFGVIAREAGARHRHGGSVGVGEREGGGQVVAVAVGVGEGRLGALGVVFVDEHDSLFGGQITVLVHVGELGDVAVGKSVRHVPLVVEVRDLGVVGAVGVGNRVVTDD